MPFDSYSGPMRLSDLLDRTARLTAKVFVRGVLIGIVTMAPAGAVMGFAIREIFAALADVTLRSGIPGASPLDVAAPMFYGAAELLIASLLFALGLMILEAAVIDMVDAELHSAPRSWQGAFVRGWNAAFRMLGQVIVEAMLLLTAFIMAVMLGAIANSPAVLVVLFVGVGVLFAWLRVSWSFGSQAIVCEHQGVVRGLGRSAAIVRGSWWRVCGLVLLFWLMLEFAMLIVTAPVQAMITTGQHAGTYDFLQQLTRPGDASPEALFLMLAAMGWSIAVLQTISAILRAVPQGAYLTLLYYDLRARRGEFDRSVEDGAA